MSAGPDLLTMARTCLAASTASPDDATSSYYLACARVAATKLAEELRSLELLLAAREGAFVQRVAPKTQLDLEE